ncbi:MAG: sigma-54 dependent transcriptional regulator [Oligoflexia bacterium]|nr:sigma-54 dependent transcriptional regulator [Oligoflexia bacterium]
MSTISPRTRLPVVLICDDDSLFHMAVKTSLKGRCECRSAYNTDEALAILRNQSAEIILLDVKMRTEDEGLKAIPRLKAANGEIAIIMSSGLKDYQTVREAMRLGATDYVAKDADPEELALTIGRVLERNSLLKTAAQQNFEATTHQRQHLLVGTSPKIQTLRKMIERVRLSNANVVIFGETGTGKEVVARQLRRTGADGTLLPFVAMDSSTIQSSTAESILFGHEKGAFTGAERPAKGIFEEASGGIVYFDEIANMPLEIQSKLLRVIQEKEVVRLGSSRPIPLEFRVICATNKDLEAMCRAGTFKDDLLQRLNVLPLELPPLRDRQEDVPLLAEHFLRRQGATAEKVKFTDDAIAVLQRYAWPGNVRELCNVVAYVTTMTEGPEIDVADLPPRIREHRPAPGALTAESGASSSDNSDGFYEVVAEFEKQLLVRELTRFEGNVSRLALALKMDRSHLYTKLRQYGIQNPRKA